MVLIEFYVLFYGSIIILLNYFRFVGLMNEDVVWDFFLMVLWELFEAFS